MKRLLSLIIATFLYLAAMAQEDTIKPVNNPSPAYSFEKNLSVGNTDKKGNAASAWFEVGDSTTNKAMIIPRVQDTSVILYPKFGMLVYSKVDSSVYFRVRTKWMNVNTGGAGASYINGYGLVLTGNVFALNITLRDSILAAARNRSTHTGTQAQSTIVGLQDSFLLYAKKTFTDSNYTNKNRYVASQFRGKPLGDRYNKTGFISGDLSNFTVTGITAAVSNGNIVLSGSTGSASSGIYLTNTYSAADRWQMKIGFKPSVKDGSSGYLAAGCFSQNTTFPINLAGLIGQNTSLDGTIRILDGASLENTRVTGSSLVFSVGDSIELTLIRNGYILSVRALNVTTNTSEVYSLFSYTGSENMPNSFRPGIMATGGIDSIYHFSFSVLEPYMNRIAIAGDSKTTFYGMNNAESLASLFSAGLDDVAMFGKGGEKTAELVNVVNSEIVAAAPEQVLICIGSNDSRYSVARATTYANIDKITDTLDKYGIKYQFFLMKENPAGLYDADQFYLDSFFKVTYPNNYISETYSVTENSPNCYNADGIHLNAYGNLLVYNSIMTSGKIYYPAALKNDPDKALAIKKNIPTYGSIVTLRNIDNTGVSAWEFQDYAGAMRGVMGYANPSFPITANANIMYFGQNTTDYAFLDNAANKHVYISQFGGVAIGGNTAPDASAVLDLKGTTKGFGLPILTTVQRNAIGSPRLGLMIFNSTIDSAQIYASGGWITTGSGGGSMTYPGAGIAVSTGSAWGTSIADNSGNWNTAYTDRLKWDGGATGLVASTGRTSLGATTVGGNLFTLTNPSAVRYIQVNADNTITLLDAAGLRTAIGAQATGNYLLQNGNSFTDHLGIGTIDNFQIRFKTNNVTHTIVTETGSWLINHSSSFGDYKLQTTGGVYFDVTGKTMRIVGLGTDNTGYQILSRDASGNSVWRDVSTIGGSDDWGSQVVQHGTTLNGSGITGDLLDVDVDEVLSGVGVIDWSDGEGTGDSMVVVNADTIKIKSIELVAGTNVTITEEHTDDKLKYTINASGSAGANTALGNLSAVAINTALLPASDNAIALGSSSKTWSDLFLGSGGVIDFNNGDVQLIHGSNNLSLVGGNLSADIAPESTVGGTGAVVGTSNTQTLSNKRWVPRVGSTTSSGTPTINTDNYDIYKLTAQAAAITSFTTNLSGTPNDGDILEIQITDNGTARAITWGSSFVASSVSLPTTTVISTTLTVVFQYYATSSYGNNKWHCVNVY